MIEKQFSFKNEFMKGVKKLTYGLVFLIVGQFLVGGRGETYAEGVVVSIAGPSTAVGGIGWWVKTKAKEWAKVTGNKVEYIDSPAETDQRLAIFQQYWAAQSPDVDIYTIDVIWPGIVEHHALDLKRYFDEKELKEFFASLIQNNTVNGKLVAIPFYADAGMLYYRTDLLEKYGFDRPPVTWKELEEMAILVQRKERENGSPDFWGFVWQGKRYEGLTCDALEWLVSHGGGTIVNPDGEVTLFNPDAIRAIERAKSWIGKISPPGVTSYAEEDARNIFQSGNALFMRNWPYAYALCNSENSPIREKFAVTVLPREDSQEGRHAATLGGWQLMVSKYSKHPETAVELVRFLTSDTVQKERALDLSLLPTRPALYNDPDILTKRPWFKVIPKVLENAVSRPSGVAGQRYNRVSEAFYTAVHQALTGQKPTKDALKEASKRITLYLRLQR